MITLNKEYNQVKNGLTNYVGAMVKATTFESDKAARQFVAASLIEEALVLMRNEEELLDLFVSKPLLRATAALLEERAFLLYGTAGGEQVLNQIEYYRQVATRLRSLADSAEE